MGIEYVEGDQVTDNKHLAEAIDMTREGSAPADGSHDYDEGMNPQDDLVKTPRDSCYYVAIEELEKINSAPKESQEKIEVVFGMLQSSMNSPNRERARIMAEAHGILQDIWVPPTK